MQLRQHRKVCCCCCGIIIPSMIRPVLMMLRFRLSCLAFYRKEKSNEYRTRRTQNSTRHAAGQSCNFCHDWNSGVEDMVVVDVMPNFRNDVKTRLLWSWKVLIWLCKFPAKTELLISVIISGIAVWVWLW